MNMQWVRHSIIIVLYISGQTAFGCKLELADSNQALSPHVQCRLYELSTKINNQLRKHFIDQQYAIHTSCAETLQHMKQSHQKIWRISQELYAYCKSIGYSDHDIKNHELYVLRCCLEL